jgi:Mrp family chromosome partitioning ATPase
MQMMALAELESAYRGNRLDLIVAETNAATPDAIQSTVEEIATFDRLMSTLLNRREELRTEIKIWKSHYTPKMPGRDRLEIELAELESRIEARHMQLATSGRLASAPGGGGTAPIGPRAIDALRRQESQVRRLYEEARKETLEIGMDDLRVQRLRGEADLVQARLEKTRGRIEQLRVESSVIGRINVISAGDRPLVPVADRRRLMAGVGGAAGVFLALSSVVGWGLCDRRLRYSDDVALRSHFPVLGIVPEIDDSRRQAASTTPVVRDLRWTLELQRERESLPLRTVAIIGGSAGGGTSSIALALGISFAQTGSSTVLLDLQGRGPRLREHLAQAGSDDPGGECADWEVPTGIPNLGLLDPGSQGEVEELPVHLLESVIEGLGQRHQVVLIDCGSVGDASGFLPACSLADAAILVCSRGSDAADLDDAATRLEAQGTRTLGVVFNRALASDVKQSGETHVLSSRSDGQLHLPELGPLALSVLRNHSAET